MSEIEPEATGSETAETEVPRGSYVAGRRATLPAGAEAPFVVFINGIALKEGPDYEIGDGEIIFNRPIIKEELGVGRKLAMFFSFFGTYRRHDTVDVQFQLEGRTQLAGDVPVSE